MKDAWYHCGHCGSLFESPLGLDERRLCAECGRPPGTGVLPAAGQGPTDRDKGLASFGKTGEALVEGVQRPVRNKRPKSVLMRVIVIWITLMLLAVWVIMSLRSREAAERDARSRSEEKNFAKGTMADERVALLTRALPECHNALAGFLTGGAPEIRNQFVIDPIDTAGKMAVFYQGNSFPRVEAGNLKRVGQEPILVGDEWMIETRWQGTEGVRFDAVFRRERATWKLDWEHFSRYGDYPWPLFLAGEGPDEAEFRLLARKLARRGESEDMGSRLRFTLLSPVFGKPEETGMESPVFVVNRRSDEGLLLEAAFDASAERKPFFGGTLEPMEPEGLVRVLVRLKRGEFGGVRSFTIERVVACHWITSNEVGFDLDKLKDDLFSAD